MGDFARFELTAPRKHGEIYLLPKENIMPRSTSPLRLLAACILLFGGGLAHAQYAWIDEKGVRQFSDRPPPPSTPAHRILKAPGRSLPPAPGAEPAPGAAAAAMGPKTLAQREQDYVERSKMREEQDKKDAAQVQRRRELAENCQAARDMRAQVESGIRIAKVGAGGERSFMSDQEKTVQLARANKLLAGCR